MPWCPNCKTEYREGITSCVDCGSTLTDDPVMVPEEKKEIFSSEKEERIDKFLDYLIYSGIESGEKQLDDETELFKVMVSKTDYKDAKNHYRAFHLIESTNTLAMDSFEGLSEEELLAALDEAEGAIARGTIPKDSLTLTSEQIKVLKADSIGNSLRNDASHTYVKKGDQYKDYMFSAYTFIGFGIVGLVFIILNMVKVLNLMTIPFTQIVMLIVFGLFLVIGIYTGKKAGKVKSQVAEEEQLSNQVEQYMTDTYTSEWLAQQVEEGTSEELAYFAQESAIKEDLTQHFVDLDESYLESLIEDFFNK